MPHSTRHSAGYTLTELLLVVTVIGITLAGTVPAISAYSRTRGFENSADILVGQFDLARNRAIAETNPYRVLFNVPEDGTYQVHDDDDGDGTVDTGEAVHGPFRLPEGSSFHVLGAATNDVLTFQPSGMLQAGQGGTIGLTCANGMALEVEVFASGMAHVSAAS
jgi:prepilin-type N-terminal cleavage/methylation domain-containing protein